MKRVSVVEEATPSRRKGLASGPAWYHVLLSLLESDLRVRYGRGPLRVLKWLLDPFALVGVYLALVTFVLDRESFAPGLSIACAVVPFQLVMSTVIAAMMSIQLRGSIILNMSFRRSLIPVSTALTEAVAFAASLLLLAALMAVYEIAPTWAMIWLPVVLAANLLFSIALSYPASLFGVWFPELQVFAISVVRTMFFLGTGLVALAETSGRTYELLRLNPLTGLFESYRDVFLYGQAPAAWQLLYPVGVAIAVLAITVPVYRRDEQHFAKIIER